MTAPQIKWLLQPQRRAFWPHRKCAITGERIGFGELFNPTQQVKVLSDGWMVLVDADNQYNQYISTQGQAILMLQGNALLQEVERCSSRIGPGG